MDRLKLSPTRSNPACAINPCPGCPSCNPAPTTPREITPAGDAALEAGALRADRARLLELVFAIEHGLIDGSAPTAWRELVKAAHWMRVYDIADAFEREMLK